MCVSPCLSEASLAWLFYLLIPGIWFRAMISKAGPLAGLHHLPFVAAFFSLLHTPQPPPLIVASESNLPLLHLILNIVNPSDFFTILTLHSNAIVLHVILCDSLYIMFLKWQNYRDGELISVCLGLKMLGWRETGLTLTRIAWGKSLND